MARNALVHKENMELGLKTENLFEETAKKENFIVRKSSLSRLGRKQTEMMPRLMMNGPGLNLKMYLVGKDGCMVKLTT